MNEFTLWRLRSSTETTASSKTPKTNTNVQKPILSAYKNFPWENLWSMFFLYFIPVPKIRNTVDFRFKYKQKICLIQFLFKTIKIFYCIMIKKCQKSIVALLRGYFHSEIYIILSFNIVPAWRTVLHMCRSWCWTDRWPGYPHPRCRCTSRQMCNPALYLPTEMHC
jgi:hypothetical protein